MSFDVIRCISTSFDVFRWLSTSFDAYLKRRRKSSKYIEIRRNTPKYVKRQRTLFILGSLESSFNYFTHICTYQVSAFKMLQLRGFWTFERPHFYRAALYATRSFRSQKCLSVRPSQRELSLIGSPLRAFQWASKAQIWPIICNNFETVQDRMSVSINH